MSSVVVSRVNGVGGKRVASIGAVSARRAMVPQQRKLALVLTVAMGVAIPLLSLSLSTVAGTLARTEHEGLALAGLGLCATVLSVSLSHLAWAVGDITRSGPKASWALAVAVDLTIILCESVHVFAADAELGTLVTAMMVSVTFASMALNVWAFIRGR